MTCLASSAEQVRQLLHQPRHAAGLMEMLHVVLAGRLQVDQHRHRRGRSRRTPRESSGCRRGRRWRRDARRRWSSRRSPAARPWRCGRRLSSESRDGFGPPLGHLRRALAARLGDAHAVGMRRRDRRRCRARRCPSASDHAGHGAGRAHHHAGADRRRQPCIDRSRSRPRSCGRRGTRPTAVGNRCRRRAPRPCNGRPASARPAARSPACRRSPPPSAAPAWSCRSRRSAPPRPSAARGSSPRCPSPSGCAGTSRSDRRSSRGSRWSETPSAARRPASRRASPPRSAAARCRGRDCNR